MTNNDDTNALPPSLLVTKGVNKFGRKLFQDLEKSTNLVFSPFSLSTALAMLTPGAKRNTLKQVVSWYTLNTQTQTQQTQTIKHSQTGDILVYSGFRQNPKNVGSISFRSLIFYFKITESLSLPSHLETMAGYRYKKKNKNTELPN